MSELEEARQWAELRGTASESPKCVLSDALNATAREVSGLGAFQARSSSSE